MINKKSPNNRPNYTCQLCDYICSNKKDFSKHLLTNKHKMLIDANKMLIDANKMLINANEPIYNENLIIELFIFFLCINLRRF